MKTVFLFFFNIKLLSLAQNRTSFLIILQRHGSAQPGNVHEPAALASPTRRGPHMRCGFLFSF